MTGGSRSGGDGAFTPSNSECALLQFETRLSSPKADVVRRLAIGEILEIRVNKAQGGGAIGVEAFYHGQLAGSIASSRFLELRECLENGYRYAAEVRSIDGGIVTVRIYPVR